MQRIVGAFPAKDILEAIQNGVNGKTWQALEKEYLKQYAREQRLTGIIVLNDKNKQIAQYHTGPKFKKVLGYVMKNMLMSNGRT